MEVVGKTATIWIVVFIFKVYIFYYITSLIKKWSMMDENADEIK